MIPKNKFLGQMRTAETIRRYSGSYLTPHERTDQQWREGIPSTSRYVKWAKTISQRILFAAKCNDIEQLATFDVPFTKWQDMAMDIVRASDDSHEVMDFLHAKKIKLNPNLIRNCRTLAWFTNYHANKNCKP